MATPTVQSSYSSADGTIYYDLTDKTGSSAEINGALFFQSKPDSSSGTGLIQAIVRVQDPGNGDGFENGYNSSFRPVSYEENTSPNFTTSLLLAEVPIVTINGTQFYEFRLDINQLSSSSLLSLDEIKLYSSAVGDGLAQGTIGGSWFTSNATLVYDMDGAGQSSVLLDATNSSGSGSSDMFFYVPVSNFGAVDPTDTYVTLYSEFGGAGVLDGSDNLVARDDPANAYLDYNGSDAADNASALLGTYLANDGFEEWSVSKQTGGTITGYKFNDANGNGLWDNGETALAGWSFDYTLSYDEGKGKNIQHVVITGTATTDANGVYSIAVPASSDKTETYTITITEQVKSGWVNTFDGDGTANGTTTFTFSSNDLTTSGSPPSDNISGHFGVTEEMNFGNFQPNPEIHIVKTTDDTDGQCLNLLAGSTVTWTYTVTNPGNVPLSGVVVTDDAGTPADNTDDFTATYVSGDSNSNGLLDTNETWIFSATGTVVAGEYTNTATADGNWAVASASGSVSDDEGDCYNGTTPSISILKETDGTDGQCLNLIAGSTVTWTYDVTNDGTAPIDGASVVVTDDAGTPADTSDDFTATPVESGGFNVGDTNTDGVLDPGETWQYTYSGTVTVGDYTNTATVNGTAFDDVNNTAPVTDSEGDCYNGATPSIDIVKETNGTNNECPVVGVGDTVTWTYAVTNNSIFDISNVVVVDDNGTPGVINNGDDFNPDPVLSGGFNVGDINQDGILNPGETWQYSATGTAQVGHYENIATVNGTATDDNGYTSPVTNSESDCYLALSGACPRTPGFWQHWTDFWNGTPHVPSQAGQDDFPTGDLLYAVDSNNDGFINGSDTAGLLIGDYNKDGLTDNGEDTIFISYTNALNLINANNKQMSDGVVKIGRDVVATWLNYLMGTNIGLASDTNSPAHFINDAVNYLQIFGDSSPSNAASSETFDTYAANHGKVLTSSAFWNSNYPGGDHSGSQIHSALDGYNNTGVINGIVYAADCDNPQFLNELSGFSINGETFLI